MIRTIAAICVIVLSVLCTLGNFWLTYGIWPRSWVSFVIFGLASMVLSLMMQAILKHEE